MTAMASPDPSSELSRLAVNGMLVRNLQSALAKSEMDVKSIPGMFRRVLDAEAWQAFIFPESTEPIRWSYGQFKTFLESPRPKGCDAKLEIILSILQGTDVLIPFHEAIRGKVGQPDHQSQLRSDEGRFGPRMYDSITHTEEPARTIPIRPPTGTSVNYAVRRLGRERPDLLERVKAGEITPSAAMIQAGFRPKQITVPDDPEAAGRRLLRHFQGERLARLIAALRG